jgi:hypothetical protein
VPSHVTKKERERKKRGKKKKPHADR